MFEQEMKSNYEKLMQAQRLHREAVEKHSAEIKTMQEGMKLLSDGKVAEKEKADTEIKNLNKKINDLEDKLKTAIARKKADEMYGSIDGLANELSKTAPEGVNQDFRRLAKSILDDPHGKEYKKAFFMSLKDATGLRGGVRKYEELVESIKNSNVDPEDSFVKKSLTTVIGEDGGYFCPPEIDLTLQKTLFETSPVRQIATVKMTTRGHYQFRIRTSLPTTAWGQEELSSISRNTEQKYQIGKIPVNNLNSLLSLSYDLLEDSIVNIEQELMSDLQEAVMLAENTAFIKGTGLERPRGILDYAQKGANNYNVNKPLKMEFVEMKLSEYNAENGGVHLSDALLDLNARVLSAYKNGAYYLMSRQIKNLVRQIKDKNNQYLFSMGQNWGGFQGVPQIRDGISGMVNGYPIVECDDLPTAFAQNQYPILFGNFKGYVVLDRLGLMVVRDNVTEKGFLILWFRKRVGGGFKFLQAVKSLKVVA